MNEETEKTRRSRERDGGHVSVSLNLELHPAGIQPLILVLTEECFSH